MNLPNVSALVLLVLAASFLLFGAFLSATTLVKDPATTIEQTETFMPPLENRALELLVEKLPGLLALLCFLFFAVPAFFLAAAGYSVWRFVGRPRHRRNEIEASLEMERESVLQTFLDELVKRLTEPQEPLREWIYEQMRRIVPQIGPGRQRRLHLLFRKSGLAGRTLVFPIPEEGEPPAPSARKENLARASALALFLLSAFGIFWGLMVGAVNEPTWKMLELSLGLKIDATDAAIAMSMCLILSATPAALGAGLLGLTRLDRRLAQRRRQARKEAQDLLLSSYRRQLASLVAGRSRAAPEGQDLLRWARALTAVSIPELDSAGRREVLETLHRRGLTPQEPLFFELGDGSFDGEDPTKIDLGGTRSPGRSHLRHNLLLETISLFLLFGFLAIVVVVALAIFNVVGVEYTEAGRGDLSELQQKAVFNPPGYLLMFTILTIPAVITILAGVGIRRFLLRPDPFPEPPWEPAANGKSRI